MSNFCFISFITTLTKTQKDIFVKPSPHLANAMQRSAIFLAIIVLACAPTATSEFHLYDDDVPNNLPKLSQERHSSSIHIILDGVNTPLSVEHLQAVNEAFKESYNEIYGQEGFQMDSVDVIEQQVHNPERKFLRATKKPKLGFEPESYLTLVTNLKGTAGMNLGVFGDRDYRTLMQRNWERKACQIILTGDYSPAELRMCFMTRPSRRAQMSEQKAIAHLEAIMA